jgi:GTP-binding protein
MILPGSGWRKNLEITDNRTLPVVAIIGRPNVGKSTLFNRLFGQRRSITDPTPGVTRDAIEEVCTVAGKDILLVDTGGYKLERDDSFDEIVAQRSVAQLERASLILLILDAGEMTAEDEAMVEMVRPYSDRLILVINKVDTPEKEPLVWEYYSLGFEYVTGVSAAHNRNISELKENIVKRLNELSREGKEKKDMIPDITIAILGKPNAGKSTLLNRLLKDERALVSPIAGTTRDIIDGYFSYRGRNIRLIDTAGIRKKKMVRENVEYYSVNRALKTIEDADVVILLMDSLEGLTEQDKKITGQIVKNGTAIVMALNKIDKLNNNKEEIKKLEERVRFLFPVLAYAPLVNISAEKGTNLDQLLGYVLTVKKQMEQRIGTAQLNEALREWIDYNPLPYVSGKGLKVKYLTQVDTAPPHFILFVNRKDGFPEFYTRYIMNQIRQEFRFSAVPIELDLKESARKDRE